MASEVRSLGLAKQAYTALDADASIKAHTTKQEEDHTDAGDYVKSFVFGGLDGTVTTFTLVCAALGGNYSYSTIVILGVAKVLSDAVSMGLGDAVSEMAEVGFVKAEKAREKWEMENYLKGEMDEMTALYTEKGFSETDARKILETMVKNKEFFLDHMLVQELGLMPPEESSPVKKGLTMFASFAVCGSLVIFPFFLAQLHSISAPQNHAIHRENAYILSVIVAVFVLAALGWLKAGFTKQSRVMSSLQYVAVGAFSAAVAFGISSTVHRLVQEG